MSWMSSKGMFEMGLFSVCFAVGSFVLVALASVGS